MKMWQRLLLFALIVGFLLALRFSGVGKYITLDNVKEQRDYLQIVVQEKYALSVLTYILLYITIVVLALPLAAILTIAGGFLFGTLFGALYANVGATTGAIISFLLVRYLIGNAVQKRFREQLANFNYYVHHYGTSYLLTVHFIAVIPFFVINVLAGLTQVPLWTFVWTTSLGILPGSFVYAFAGQQLNHIESVRDIFSFNIILAFVLLALLALLPIVVRFIRSKRRVNEL